MKRSEDNEHDQHDLGANLGSLLLIETVAGTFLNCVSAVVYIDNQEWSVNMC